MSPMGTQLEIVVTTLVDRSAASGCGAAVPPCRRRPGAQGRRGGGVGRCLFHGQLQPGSDPLRKLGVCEMAGRCCGGLPM